MLKRIHHINFIVEDLNAAVKQYDKLFNMKFQDVEYHPERPVKVARYKIGDVWLVLVQPIVNYAALLAELADPAR